MGLKNKLPNLLSMDALNPLSPSPSITGIGEDPGTSTGLDEVPEIITEGLNSEAGVVDML